MAKSQAAHKMIQKLRDLPMEKDDAFQNIDEDDFKNSDHNLDIKNVIKVPWTDMTIDTDDTADEVEAISENAPVDVAKDTVEEEVIEVIAKPKKSISSFFAKVSKEDCLKKVEMVNNQLKVKALVHTSPGSRSRESSSSPKVESETSKTKTKKNPRSNVSRSAAETEKIEVVHVDEINENFKENVQESDVVEMELVASENADAATRKISSKLFSTKSKRRSSHENVDKNGDESDASVNIESLENTPIRNPQSRSKSPLKKVPIQTNQETKSVSAFSVLVNKKKNSSSVEAFEDCEKVVKENAHSSPISGQTTAVFNNAFNTLMKNSRKSFEPPSPETDESKEETKSGPDFNQDESVVIVNTTPMSGRSTPLSGQSTPAKEATESTPAVIKTPKSNHKGRKRKVLDDEPIADEVNEVVEMKEDEENKSTLAPTPGSF